MFLCLGVLRLLQVKLEYPHETYISSLASRFSEGHVSYSHSELKNVLKDGAQDH